VHVLFSDILKRHLAECMLKRSLMNPSSIDNSLKFPEAKDPQFIQMVDQLMSTVVDQMCKTHML